MEKRGILKLVINGRNIFYDTMSGCMAEDLSALKEYVEKNSLRISIDEPCSNQDLVQGFFFVLTTKCNLNCKYCYSVTQNYPKSMQKDGPATIIKKYLKKSSKYVIINFFGGEPTLEMDTIKNTVEYLKTIKDKFIYLRISTNGLVSKETLDYLIDNRFHITVSSDGVVDENSLLDKVRQAGHVENTLRYLSERNAVFSIRYTATSANCTNLLQSIKYWKSIGVPLAHIEPYHPIGNNKEEMDLLPSVKDYVEVFMHAVNESEEVGLMITTGAYMNLLTPSSYFCTGSGGRFNVYNPDGSMTTCYRVQSFESKYKSFIIGNWMSDDDSSIWDNNESILRSHTVTNMKPCASCKNAYLCSGGCLMRNLTQAGSIDVVDKWLCSVKHSLIKDAIQRLWNSYKTGSIPVVLGRFIFEDYLARNPSIPTISHTPMRIPMIQRASENGVFDIFDCLGMDRRDELMLFNRKIARTECL